MTASPRLTSIASWLLAPGFLAVGAWLAFASPAANIPAAHSRVIAADDIRPGAWRDPIVTGTIAIAKGTTKACVDCHRPFAKASESPRDTLVEHKHIVLRHGMNTRCLNCHDGEQRDKLVLHDGTLVGYDEAPRLCSQCHGTVYRDWQSGMHGKTTGSWDSSSGKQRRLRCIECHDPHSPAYLPIPPLPGPNTLRMGDQTRESEHEGKHSPLRRWSQPQRTHDPSSTSHKEGTP